MKRMKFSAQELYVMAATAGKGKMFGIPDGFAWTPDEEIPAARQRIKDALLDEEILAMDFDGKISVTPDYAELVNVYCDCKKCLTVNRQKAEGESEDVIFWQGNGKLYRAEVLEEDYVFSEIDDLSAEAELTQNNWSTISTAKDAEAVIPQIALTKAKRYGMQGDTEETLRILKQNGADDRLAAVLMDGLQEKAQYLGLLLMDIRSGKCEKTEKAWLNSRGVLFAMRTTVVNFRTCTVFTETDKDTALADEKELIDTFLGRE